MEVFQIIDEQSAEVVIQYLYTNHPSFGNRKIIVLLFTESKINVSIYRIRDSILRVDFEGW